MPLVEERLHVGKRVVETGHVHVRKRTRERTEIADAPLLSEALEVRCVPVNRIVDAPPAARVEGGVTIVPVLEEVMVVHKQLVLREELHIERRRFEMHEPQRVSLRREEIETYFNPATKGTVMATTLVGVFDDHSDAQRARERLIDAGIDREAVEMTSGNTATMGDPTAISSGTSGKQEHEGGIRGFFRSLFGGGDDRDEHSDTYAEAVRRGNAVVTVHLADDSRVDQASEILEDCGAVDVDERVAQWKSAGYTAYDPSAPPLSDDEIARGRQNLQSGSQGLQGEPQNMQVIQEDLEVGKRQVSRGGVRVRRHVSERPVEEQVRLREARAVVERQAVDRPAGAADLEALEDADLEIRETSEEPVVSKTARVVEEVKVGKQASERTETVRDKVRRSDVDVEPLDGSARSIGASTPRDTPLPPYGGTERRSSRGAYAGVERRAGH